MTNRMEGVILTGGASSRMGHDKATLPIHHEPMAHRIVKELKKKCCKVTVCGPERVLDAAHIADDVRYQGPLATLRRFEPTYDFVFVAACDMPLFNAQVIDILEPLLGDFDAVVPIRKGRWQPLCGLYRKRAFEGLRELQSERLMDWLDTFHIQTAIIEPDCWVASCNTLEELTEILDGAHLRSGRIVV